jgi:hypothetical protein
MNGLKNNWFFFKFYYEIEVWLIVENLEGNFSQIGESFRLLICVAIQFESSFIWS